MYTEIQFYHFSFFALVSYTKKLKTMIFQSLLLCKFTRISIGLPYYVYFGNVF